MLLRWFAWSCLGACWLACTRPTTTPLASPDDARREAALESPEVAPPASANTPEKNPPDDSNAADPVASAAPPVPPARFESLEVPGFLDAVVSLPATRERQPVLVATHGAGGAPEHHCQAWRELLGDRGLILCPRGAMIDRRYGAAAGFYYPNHHVLEKELLACVSQFEASYEDMILGESYVYSGYSQGATMGALVLPQHAKLFPRAVLIEGGFNEWDLRGAKTFLQQGGQRVAFICGGAGCKHAADRSAGILRRAGVEVVTRHARGSGHTYLGGVAEQTAGTFPWLVQGDVHWGLAGD